MQVSQPRRNTWRSQILADKGARLQVRENVQKMMSESSVEEAKEKLQEIEEHEKKLDTDKEEVGVAGWGSSWWVQILFVVS